MKKYLTLLCFLITSLSFGDTSINLPGQATPSLALQATNSSKQVTLKAPASVTTSYSLIFPAAQGSASQHLTNDGAGNLSWVTDGGGGGGGTVTSVSGTAPIAVNSGTTDAVVSMPQSSNAVNGWLSFNDWNAFNQKQSALSAASSSVNGYLSSTDWSTFNGRQPLISAGTTSQYYRGDKTFQTLDTTATAEGTNLYYTDARARLALSGTAPVAYNNSTGVVSMGAASASTNGYLTSADWSAFTTAVGGGVSAARLINTTSPLTGGGDLTADRTIAIPAATNSVNGYLTSTDWTIFNAKQVTLSAASNSVNGYLSSTDWATFNSKQAALGFTPVNQAGDTMTGDLKLNTHKIGIGSATPASQLDIKGNLDRALTGTVSVTAGTAAVTGAGGAIFTSELRAGNIDLGSPIKIGSEVFYVISIADSTHLTLNANHIAGASAVTAYTDSNYFLVKDGKGNPMLSLDSFGNFLIGYAPYLSNAAPTNRTVAINGDLQVSGAFVPGALAPTVPDPNDQITGTISCDGSTPDNCVGTGTLFDSQLRIGGVIGCDGIALFVKTITDDTHMTLWFPEDGFGCDGVGVTAYTNFASRDPLHVRAVVSGFTNDSAFSGSQNEVIITPEGNVAINQFFNFAPALSVNLQGDSFSNAAAIAATFVGGSVGVGTATPAATFDVNGSVKLGSSGNAFSNMGTCTISSTTISTSASNVTCTGVPASVAIAVHCTGNAAFTTPTGDAVYCRATGTADQLACDTILTNTQAMAYTCMWVQP